MPNKPEEITIKIKITTKSLPKFGMLQKDMKVVDTFGDARANEHEVS